MSPTLDFSIIWDYQVRKEVREFYEAITGILCKKYHEQLPECFIQPFTVKFVQQVDSNLGSEFSGYAGYYDVQVIIDPFPSVFTLNGDIERISHELAHLVMLRKVAGRKDGQYVYAGDPYGTNAVHLAFNDYHSGDTLQLIDKRRYSSIKYLLRAFRLPLPWYFVPVAKLDYLLDKQVIFNQMIREGRAPKGILSYAQP